MTRQLLRTPRVRNLPLYVGLTLLAAGGLLLLDRSDQQARDTIRKHHLEDIEQALYAARTQHGTYPPYAQASWCGQLDDPANLAARQEVEAALRAQNEKYANPAKPFPTDPLADQSPKTPSYFYWKHSPASFELYAVLEAAPTGERTTLGCPAGGPFYDYGIASVWREEA